MANVIIGIHGLGNKPQKRQLELWWKLAMQEGLKNNNFKTSLPKFELVYWADILNKKPLDESESDENSPYFLDEKYEEAKIPVIHTDHSIRKKVVDFLSYQINRIFLNDDFTLNYSFITDAIINKYFKDLEIYYKEDCNDENDSSCKAKDLIRERLYKMLDKYKKYDIMLISHSMGSIIAFDVLTFLAPYIKINTFITMGSPLGLPIVISKIAAEQKRIHNSENHMITPPGISNGWYNFSDILDKVAFHYKLNEDFSANKNGIKPFDFLVENNYQMNGEPNPHKSYGYLRSPEFATILNEFILSEKLNLKEKIIRKTSHLTNYIKNQFSKK